MTEWTKTVIEEAAKGTEWAVEILARRKEYAALEEISKTRTYQPVPVYTDSFLTFNPQSCLRVWKTYNPPAKTTKARPDDWVYKYWRLINIRLDQDKRYWRQYENKHWNYYAIQTGEKQAAIPTDPQTPLSKCDRLRMWELRNEFRGWNRYETIQKKYWRKEYAAIISKRRLAEKRKRKRLEKRHWRQQKLLGGLLQFRQRRPNWAAYRSYGGDDPGWHNAVRVLEDSLG